MKRIVHYAAFALLLALFCWGSLAGCSRNDGPPVAGDGMIITLETTPTTPVAKQELGFRIKLMQQGIGAEGAKVTLALESKQGSSLANVPVPLTESAPGLYTGKSTLPAAGNWVAHIRADKMGQTATSDVTLDVK